jgi:hypothetical protein
MEEGQTIGDFVTMIWIKRRVARYVAGKEDSLAAAGHDHHTSLLNAAPMAGRTYYPQSIRAPLTCLFTGLREKLCAFAIRRTQSRAACD